MEALIVVDSARETPSSGPLTLFKGDESGDGNGSRDTDGLEDAHGKAEWLVASEDNGKVEVEGG